MGHSRNIRTERAFSREVSRRSRASGSESCVREAWAAAYSAPAEWARIVFVYRLQGEVMAARYGKKAQQKVKRAMHERKEG
jgi:hypothetical protein